MESLDTLLHFEELDLTPVEIKWFNLKDCASPPPSIESNDQDPPYINFLDDGIHAFDRSTLIIPLSQSKPVNYFVDTPDLCLVQTEEGEEEVWEEMREDWWNNDTWWEDETEDMKEWFLVEEVDPKHVEIAWYDPSKPTNDSNCNDWENPMPPPDPPFELPR